MGLGHRVLIYIYIFIYYTYYERYVTGYFSGMYKEWVTSTAHHSIYIIIHC